MTPPGPPNIESLSGRAFSFYPPVVNIEHNEWKFEKATWSEVLVTNTKSGLEIWVPRRFLGEVSRVDEPVMIVGLRKELEYKAGSLWPFERRVIEMPKAVNDYARAPLPEPPGRIAPITGIRLDDGGAESRIGKLMIAVLVVGILLVYVVFSMIRSRSTSSDVTFVPILQQSLGLSAIDDVHSITRKLGQPREDRWKDDAGEIQYRLLRYPDRQLYVILMGKDRESARYIGALDDNWKPVDSVQLPNAGNTRSMLNRLARF
ncbi:MAG: hypothetical protein SFV51_18750 [Bryobacteraceae bacterium]|nr:hypothetical protein [Bryobacteraceae bacterium]